VLLERLDKERLPRALALKEKVDRGETLSDYDFRFLKDVFGDANKIKPLLDRHPEYQDLATRVIHLYNEITKKALENEEKG
jgi:hypothetical protein